MRDGPSGESRMSKVDELVAEARRMDQLKHEIDELGYKKAQLQKEYDALRYRKIPEIMEYREVEKLGISGLGTLYLEGKVDVSIPAAARDEAYRYVEEVLESGEIIKPFIQTSTLKAAGKQWVMDGQELPEDLFKVSIYQLAKILRR
jgi:hypothetical protein